MRRLEEQGSIQIVRHNRGSEARAAALQAIALKRAWTTANLRLAPWLAEAPFAAFFADVAEARWRPADCAVTTMRCNGVIASVAIDVTCARRRAAHIIVYDQRFQRLSAGTLMLQEWIRAASGEGIATFDLLAPPVPIRTTGPTPASRSATMRQALPGLLGFFGRCARANARRRLADAQLALQRGGGGRVLKQQLLARIDDFIGRLRHQGGLVETR